MKKLALVIVVGSILGVFGCVNDPTVDQTTMTETSTETGTGVVDEVESTGTETSTAQ